MTQVCGSPNAGVGAVNGDGEFSYQAYWYSFKMSPHQFWAMSQVKFC